VNPTTSFRQVRCLLVLAPLLAWAGCAHTAQPNAMSGMPIVTPSSMPDGLVAPRLLQAVNPSYPTEMRARGITSTVKLSCVVDANGAVKDVALLDDEAGGFADAAIAAVAKWSFTPGTRNGAPTPMRVIVPVTFTLEEGDAHNTRMAASK
jgi:TonB family protein